VPGRQHVRVDDGPEGLRGGAGCLRRGGRQLHRHRRRLLPLGARQQGRRVGERARSLAERAQAPRLRADRHQGHGADGARPERLGPLAHTHHGRRRGLAAAAADRLHRPLPGPLGRQGDPARGDAACLRRSGAPGQGALPRLLELPRVAAHPRPLGERPPRLRALRVPAAEVQPGDPRRVRARARAPLPRARGGRDSVLLAGERVPLGQVPLGRGAAQDGPGRRRGEDLHARARVPRARRGREGGGGRQCHARAGVALVAGAPAGDHRADRERDDGGAAQGAGGRDRAQAGRGGDGGAGSGGRVA
jgi:hypothetical protein